MATAGRVLQLIAMTLVIYALFVGVFERSMQGELTYLFVAIGLFTLGWLMGRKRTP